MGRYDGEDYTNEYYRQRDDATQIGGLRAANTALAGRLAAAVASRDALAEQVEAVRALALEFGQRAMEARSDMSWRKAAKELRDALDNGFTYDRAALLASSRETQETGKESGAS